jgi:conjugative transfer pilus assembly protein TraH
MRLPRGAILLTLGALEASGAITGPAQAQSWAETWFDNVTYSSPGSFEDQTRGYLTAGGMSGRVDVHNDYLMSVTLPKVRAGCGGIDMFLGGIGGRTRHIHSSSYCPLHR